MNYEKRYLVDALAKAALPYEPQVSNPLRMKTKAEGLSILEKHGLSKLLTYTNSCAHRRNRSSDTPHCGVCSQCVDRRFATLAAGLDQFDPLEGYETDIFRGELEGNAVTMAESYVRFAEKVQPLTPEGLFMELPQLADASEDDDKSPDSTSLQYASLIERHANSVINVVSKQVSLASHELVLKHLPATCLITMSVQTSQAAIVQKIDLQHSDNYRSVQWDGKLFTLTSQQAEVIRMLYQAYNAGTPDLSWNQIQKRLNGINMYPQRMRDIFRSSPAWGKLIIRKGHDMYRLNF